MNYRRQRSMVSFLFFRTKQLIMKVNTISTTELRSPKPLSPKGLPWIDQNSSGVSSTHFCLSFDLFAERIKKSNSASRVPLVILRQFGHHQKGNIQMQGSNWAGSSLTLSLELFLCKLCTENISLTSIIRSRVPNKNSYLVKKL